MTGSSQNPETPGLEVDTRKAQSLISQQNSPLPTTPNIPPQNPSLSPLPPAYRPPQDPFSHTYPPRNPSGNPPPDPFSYTRPTYPTYSSYHKPEWEDRDYGTRKEQNGNCTNIVIGVVIVHVIVGVVVLVVRLTRNN
ncbi:hypothetical protein GLAREA_02648 [Glarea lozoyensis ATCC 20868]|uniref:Uncharacterized protein n=1 Tax=Glarea lozoyensis (strain ATCC 20868 / MF5171) TaxID=1116229 RepID=S3CNI5_GLAL2|nr:uncharacterized protein GLAREA_02648 [Glarea lozoyensis ATCC 20868]EPE26734.1 hypothetical protein GLAREA_02648 [Glarea lozoyensis ATCC 20868]